MRGSKVMGVVMMLLVVACVDPFEIESTASADMLVVEGVISGQLKKQQISLSRATSLTERKIVHESGAVMTLSDQDGNEVSFSEVSPGTYETPEFAAQPGNKYKLYIKTTDGGEYASDEVRFKEGTEIGEVYGEYVNHPDGKGKGIQIYVDAEDPTGETRFYRWNFIETYEVHAPFPSNWVWLGGSDVVYRADGIDTCFATDTLRNILIRSTKNLTLDKITKQELRYIPDYSHILRFRYSVLVQQFPLSEESYGYWENLKKISEEQGSLSDIQPGSLSGNISSLTNTEEVVLGYFEVSQVSERRIFISAVDYYDQGLKRPANFRSNCYEINPIFVHWSKLEEAMKRYERTMYIWEVIGDFPATTFELMPKSCCDCRDQGPTTPPPFFE